MTRHEVVVVGAGPAGLAAAAQLRGAGLDPLVIERSDTIGSAWRTRYDSFRLHTIRWLSGLPGMPMPAALGPWVTRDDFVGYLGHYADRFAIAPRFGTVLQRLARADGGWVLSTSQGELEAGRVVLATGACTEPHIPPWTGRDSFGPPVIHTSEYRRPGPYTGHPTLLIGSGNSATEVAADLAASGVPVELAVRTPPSILRRDFGRPTFSTAGHSAAVPARDDRRPPGRRHAPVERAGSLGPGTAGARETVLPLPTDRDHPCTRSWFRRGGPIRGHPHSPRRLPARRRRGGP